MREHPDGTLVDVRVTPRSSRNQIDGFADDTLKVRLSAPPIDGAANEALRKLFSSQFKIPKSRVEIISGVRGRTKQVLLRGIGVAEALARLSSAQDG